MLKSKKSKGSQLEIWLMNFVIGIPLVLLYFVVGIPSYFEIKELPVGPFKYNDKIYYANSSNQYCNYGTFSEYLYTAEQSSLQNLTQIPMIPASYVDLKECVVNPKEGFFKVAKEFYYSNGNDAYCRVVDIEMLSRFKAGSEMSSIYVFERLPPTLKNDGVCRDKLTGLFRVGEDTFLGKNSSYCKIKNSQEFVNNLPAGEVEKSLVFKKLPNLTDTGHCNNLDLLLATVEGEIGAEQQKVDSSDHWNASNSGDDPCLLGKSSDGRPIYFISKDYYNTKDLFRLTPSSFLTRIKLPSSNPLKISLNQGAAVCFKKGEVYQDFSLSVVGLVAGSEARLDISAFGDEASVAIIVPAKENYSQDTKMFSATFAIKIEDRDNVRIANLLIDGRGRRGSGRGDDP